jgi:hypothetical protein
MIQHRNIEEQAALLHIFRLRGQLERLTRTVPE